MLSKQYYFLSTLLPSLEYGQEPQISIEELQGLLRDHLSPKDFQAMRSLLEIFDLTNLNLLLRKQTPDSLGFYSIQELEDFLLSAEGLSGYIEHFFAKYAEEKSRLAHFEELIYALYFTQKHRGFVAFWLQFEGGMRLHLTLFRALDQKKNLRAIYPFSCQEHPVLEELLWRYDKEPFEPLEPYERVYRVYKDLKQNPLELEKALNKIRFETLTDSVLFSPFTIDRILAYVLRFKLIEKDLRVMDTKDLDHVKRLVEGVDS